MQYVLPTFPLTVAVFTGTGPRPPLRLLCPGNLCYGDRLYSPIAKPADNNQPTLACMLLIVPAGTDLRGPLQTTGSDTVLPTGLRIRSYKVLFVDDFNKGTPAEFRGAIIQQVSQGTPLD